MALFQWMKPLTILFFVCSTPHYTLLDKGFKSIENSLGKLANHHIPRRHQPWRQAWTYVWFVFIRVSTILDNHMYGLYSLEFQQKDERLDLRLAVHTWIACVLTNNVILLGLPNAHQNLFAKLLTSILLSKHAFRVILRLATLGWSGGNEMWIHYLISKMWNPCSSHVYLY